MLVEDSTSEISKEKQTGKSIVNPKRANLIENKKRELREK